MWPQGLPYRGRAPDPPFQVEILFALSGRELCAERAFGFFSGPGAFYVLLLVFFKKRFVFMKIGGRG